MSPMEHRTPGRLIEELMVARGWTQRVLALVLGCDESGLNKIVAGKRPVDAKLALALGDVFSVDPERFLALQASYDLAQAKIVVRPDPGRLARAHLFGALPVTQMIKRGWLAADDVRDVATVEAELVKFFRASRPDDIEILPYAAKKTSITGPVSPAELAWFYRVRQIAEETLVPPYSGDRLRATIPKLHALMSDPEMARHVPRLLMECGVRYVIVETIGSAKVDGVCFWLKDGTSPVIGMSLRFDRIDNFWFVLRHELEHVLLGHGRTTIMLDTDMDGINASTSDLLQEEERLANEAAADFCVPKEKLRKFIAVKSPLFPERDLVGLARTLHVHPGVVAGQLRHKTGRYKLFAKHLVKVRDVVARTAMVDGWGNVVPVEQ